jgi:hypothetical protein
LAQRIQRPGQILEHQAPRRRPLIRVPLRSERAEYVGIKYFPQLIDKRRVTPLQQFLCEQPRAPAIVWLFGHDDEAGKMSDAKLRLP